MKRSISAWFIFLVSAFFLFGFSLQMSYAQETDFERWQRQQRESFNQFVADENARFADFLRQQWSSFETNEPETPPSDVEPKPIDVPVAEDTPEETDEPVREIPVKPVPEIPPVIRPVRPQPDPEPQPQPQPEPVPVPPTPPSSPVAPPLETFSWLDYDVPAPRLTNVRSVRLGRLSNDSIADAWLELSKTNYEEVLEVLQTFARDNALNDWAYALVIKDYVREIIPISRHNEAVLLTWFLLHQSGFHANAGYSGSQLHLLMPVTESLYSINFYTLGDNLPRFYVMPAGHQAVENPGPIRTYTPDAASNLRILDMQIRKLPLNTRQDSGRSLSFRFQGEQYSFNLPFDATYAALLNRFPSMRPEFFFGAPVSHSLQQSVSEQLIPVIDDMNRETQLNFLLRFVQTAFDYKTDTEQFGKQFYMTPDQLLYFPYSDCDDRAIMFSWLVRELLGKEAVGVSWPGHMAAAVRIESPLGGDIIRHGDHRYLICDPTYINANAGMTMPQYRDVPATLHFFD
ncbi:MAG: hypothetical protein LAT67_08655 [Balneolales bacterium]|nr:hypothetical protein [Balneolales bacterium]